MDILKGYSVESLMIFILFLIFYWKCLFVQKDKYQKPSIILASVFSVLTVLGQNFYAYYNVYDISIWREIFSLKSLVFLIGLIPFYFCIVHMIMKKLCEWKNKDKEKYNNRLFAIISMASMLLVWGGVYLLTYFPGTLSPDSILEYSMFVDGINIGNDHHPVLHVLFMALFYHIGYGLFGTPNMGVATVAIAQMIILASIFTYSLVFLRKRNCPKILSYGLLLFYVFASMFGYYSITMWKDVLFGGFLLLLTIECYKLYENKDNLKLKNMISFGAVSLLVIFFRNNAVYAFLILTITILILLRKDFKKLSLMFLSVLLIFVFVKGPIFTWCGIKKSSSAEYVGMPIQQIGRVVMKNKVLSDEQKEKIEKMIPMEIIPTTYNPIVSDGIKFNENFNINVFNEDKIGYTKIYLEILFENLPTTTEAYFISTLGYWYPNVEYWSVANTIWENDLGVTMSSKTNDEVKKLLEKGDDRSAPLVGMQWSIGLCVWAIAILSVSFIIKRKIYGIIPFLPCIAIWATMMIASPVWGEFRYVFGLFASLPFLIGIFFVSNAGKPFSKNIKKLK